jgi:hypothetical protein
MQPLRQSCRSTTTRTTKSKEPRDSDRGSCSRLSTAQCLYCTIFEGRSLRRGGCQGPRRTKAVWGSANVLYYIQLPTPAVYVRRNENPSFATNRTAFQHDDDSQPFSPVVRCRFGVRPCPIGGQQPLPGVGLRSKSRSRSLVVRPQNDRGNSAAGLLAKLCVCPRDGGVVVVVVNGPAHEPVRPVHAGRQFEPQQHPQEPGRSGKDHDAGAGRHAGALSKMIDAVTGASMLMCTDTCYADPPSCPLRCCRATWSRSGSRTRKSPPPRGDS